MATPRISRALSAVSRHSRGIRPPPRCSTCGNGIYGLFITRRVVNVSTFSTSPIRHKAPFPPTTQSDDTHPLTDREYHALADSVMEYLEHTLEEIGEEANITGFDVVVAAGVLNLSLGDMGTYVINKQPPNKQIWLSSPISGPKRFDYVPATKHWTYLRTGERLADLLSAELSAHLKQEVKLSEDL